MSLQMDRVTKNMLVLPMFSASVYLSHVNLNPYEADHPAGHPKVRECGQSGAAAGAASAGPFAASLAAALGNGTRITDIETRPISP